MKKSLRLLCLLMALAVLTLMAVSCSSEKETDDGVNTGDNNADEPKDETAKTAVIEEQVLFENSGVKVTAKEYVSDLVYGDGVKLFVENTGDIDVSVTCDAAIVNDYMINTLFIVKVAAGKSANEVIYFTSTELESAGIDGIGQIEFYFRAYDDSYENVFENEYSVIKTSLYDSVETVPNDEGTELYNKNGVRIVGKGIYEDSLLGASYILFVENKGEQNVILSCDDLSVNGFMLTSLFSSNIYKGTMAMEDISLLSSELEENGITDINEIEFTVRILDPDSYSELDKSEPITITIE